MRKWLLTLSLGLSLVLAACGPGPVTVTPLPTATVPAPPPTAGAALPTETVALAATLAPTGTASMMGTTPGAGLTGTPAMTGTTAPTLLTPGAGLTGTPGMMGTATPTLVAATTPSMVSTTMPTVTPTPPGTPGALTKVVLAVGYIPNVQFAPYYVAQDKGYYAAEGLDVEIKYGSAPDVLKVVGEGTLDFTVTSGDEMVQARGAGIPVTYIMAQYQKYPVGATAIGGNGAPLKTPADLKGRRIGIPGMYGSSLVALKALLKAGGLTETDVTISTINYTQVASLQTKQVDVAMTYLMNEPVQLQALGSTVENLSASDYVNLISVGIATGAKNIETRPGLVQRFVRASQRGLQDSLADPDGAFASSLKRIPELPADQVPLQRQVLTATLGFEQPPANHPLGWSDPTGWQATSTFMHEAGLSPSAVDPATLFTNQFVETSAP